MNRLTATITATITAALMLAGAAVPAAPAAETAPLAATASPSTSAASASRVSTQVVARGSASTAACRRVAATAVPRNAAARGWRIDCLPARSFTVTMRGKRTGPYVGYTDQRARRITIAARGLTVTRARQIARYQVAAIAKADLRPVRSAAQMCAQVAREYTPVLKGEGWTVRCTTRRITYSGQSNNTIPGGSITYGLAEYGPKRVTILATTDLAQMRLTAAHELGHVIAARPDAAALREAMTRAAGRNDFGAGDYMGRATEIWAESFARAWSRQASASSIQPRISTAQVEALLRQTGLPYTVR